MPKQTRRSSPSSSSSRRRPTTRASARSARRQAPYPARQSTSPGPSRSATLAMAEQTPSRDRIVDIYSIFEPNSQTPDEFRACIRDNSINKNLSEHASLRGQYYMNLVKVISDHAMQDSNFYERLAGTVPEDIPKLAAIEKQLQRDLWQHRQAPDSGELERSLQRRTADIRQVTHDNWGNLHVNVYALGVLLLVIDSITELDSQDYEPVEEHTRVLEAAVRQVVELPEDVLRALLESMERTVTLLHRAAYEQGSSAATEQAEDLASKIRFVQGDGGGRE